MDLKQFKAELYKLAQQKLFRGDRAVKNSVLTEIIAMYVKKGINKATLIIEDFATIKPAKSILALCDNIKRGERAGTRSDRTEVDYTGLLF